MDPVLLPGEPDEAHDRREVAHWVRTYIELVQITTEIASTAPTPRLEARLLLMMTRLKVWQERARSLGVGEAAG